MLYELTEQQATAARALVADAFVAGGPQGDARHLLMQLYERLNCPLPDESAAKMAAGAMAEQLRDCRDYLRNDVIPLFQALDRDPVLARPGRVAEAERRVGEIADTVEAWFAGTTDPAPRPLPRRRYGV